MTKPSTSDVRAWARAHGFTVADRGRLSPDVLAAYAAAHPSDVQPTESPSGEPSGESSRAVAKKAAKRPAKRAAKRPAKRAAAKRTASRAARTATARPSGPSETRGAEAAIEALTTREPESPAAAQPAPGPESSAPAPSELEQQVAELREQLRTLLARVERLESAPRGWFRRRR